MQLSALACLPSSCSYSIYCFAILDSQDGAGPFLCQAAPSLIKGMTSGKYLGSLCFCFLFQEKREKNVITVPNSERCLEALKKTHTSKSEEPCLAHRKCSINTTYLKSGGKSEITAEDHLPS